ncbi:hypothetical protein CFN79_09360 [Chromobacterium vaccinii]|uniref:caspase family protein n=1 Tax=Chromobacterium vaccinii TaxID=1108595 RepID=UPI000CE9653F|nr:caspase family protein [Chromobacterium vaccinii]AVG16043.1 hypothetical protein CFN79_09360 [Chromobacterium vaccinii]
MTLLVDRRQIGEPGVHAILIGVGRYPNLCPGHGLGAYAPDAGLKELTSPLHSVEAFAQWLQDDMNLSGTPLRTLRALGSSPTRATPWPESEPTFNNIQQHVNDWFDDVNTHEGNLALFYFCGHGLRVGDVQAVLTQDFGSNRHAPFDHSFDPEFFADAVRKAKALRQIFLVDACSTEVSLPEDYHAVQPRVLIQPARNHHLGVVKQSFFRASEFGTLAYGQENAPSIFMEALLRAMKGAGALQRRPKQWVIGTDMLKTALNWLIQSKPEGQGQEVAYGAGLSASLDFHELRGAPVVPIQVSCDPQEYESFSALHIDKNEVCGANQWQQSFEMPVGSYDFEAIEKSAHPPIVHGLATNELVHPPYALVSIPCGDTP